MTVTSVCSGEASSCSRSARAAAAWPSPTSADRIRTRRGPADRRDVEFAVAASHIGARASPARAGAWALTRARKRKPPCGQQRQAQTTGRVKHLQVGLDVTMGRYSAAIPTARRRTAATPPGQHRCSRGRGAGARAPCGSLGALGLLGILTTVFLLTAGAATSPSQYVPGRSGGWPGWMAGPLEGLGVGISHTSFQNADADHVRELPAGPAGGAHAARARPAAAIVAANLILLLGPPLISQDVFGYMSFARLGALHGLDPYTHVAAEVPTDPVFGFVGWPFLHSPYGPLFTLASYATAPLGLAGALWTFKAVAVAVEPRHGRARRAGGRQARSLAPLGRRLRGPEPRAARAGRGRRAQRHADHHAARRRAGAHRGRRAALSGGRHRAGDGRGDQDHRGPGAALPAARATARARAPQVAATAGLGLFALVALGADRLRHARC